MDVYDSKTDWWLNKILGFSPSEELLSVKMMMMIRRTTGKKKRFHWSPQRSPKIETTVLIDDMCSMNQIYQQRPRSESETLVKNRFSLSLRGIIVFVRPKGRTKRSIYLVCMTMSSQEAIINIHNHSQTTKTNNKLRRQTKWPCS